MNIESTKQGKAAVIKLAGRMDAETTGQFDAACARSLEDGATTLVIDLSELHYISSAGLGSILRLAKRMQAKGGAVLLCGVKGLVKEVFEMTNLLPAFQVFDTAEAACRSL